MFNLLTSRFSIFLLLFLKNKIITSKINIYLKKIYNRIYFLYYKYMLCLPALIYLVYAIIYILMDKKNNK